MIRSGDCPWMPWTTASRRRDALQSAIAGVVGGGPEHAGRKRH